MDQWKKSWKVLEYWPSKTTILPWSLVKKRTEPDPCSQPMGSFWSSNMWIINS